MDRQPTRTGSDDGGLKRCLQLSSTLHLSSEPFQDGLSVGLSFWNIFRMLAYYPDIKKLQFIQNLKAGAIVVFSLCKNSKMYMKNCEGNVETS
ncbi:unnamed protein product [Victoria cruziana]